MKKSFMNNIKNFVDSNVRQRIDKAANNNCEFFGDDLLLVEKQFEDIRHVCAETGKRISALLQSASSTTPLSVYSVQNVQASLNNLSNLTNVSSPPPPTSSTTISGHETLLSNQNQAPLSNRSKSNVLSETTSLAVKNSGNHHALQQQRSKQTDTEDSTTGDIRKYKKLPIVGFLKFLVKSGHKLKRDSLLSTTLTHCSQLQTQLTKLYLSYEHTIEIQCLRPIQQILDVDVPNVIKLRKLFIKSHNDLESVRAKYNGASQKQQQQQLHLGHSTSTSYTISQNAQQANINKLDQLKKELDDAITRFEQARDTYATELYAFVCRETELVNLFMKFYQHQFEYQQQVAQTIQNSLPSLSYTLANTPRKVVFGTPLEEHLRCTGRNVSLVIELCIHLLYSNALHEEGLFRIPGGSVKIKKLKNAINAWFVTLASQNELENNLQQQVELSPSLLAIYGLFKNIVGQQSSSQTALVGQESTITMATNNQSATRDDLTLTHNANLQSSSFSSSSQDHQLRHNQQHLVFDVHTIAGLLKLYLRELNEPLFTYALYDQWIDATVKTLNSTTPATTSSTPNQTSSEDSKPSVTPSLTPLKQVVEQLPKANYDNLKLLIRFLHLLTCHREFNRMTATNLAITMAPSLIWAKPAPLQQPSSDNQVNNNALGGDQVTQVDELHTLNMQMSSVGISASLHALVIENLINHAETLFPGSICFNLSGLQEQQQAASATLRAPFQSELDNNQTTYVKTTALKQERCAKSTSPTGLSTASSSSYSSTASVTSTPTAGLTNKSRHSRKGGSMDGLLNNDDAANHGGIGIEINARPMSVHIHQQQEHSSNQPKQQPPPLPPAPTVRSHSRQAESSSSCPPNISRPSTSTTHKPPAPPVPTLERQPKITSQHYDQQIDCQVKKCVQSKQPAAGTSLRGTGSILVQQPPTSNLNATRPSVPPPSRPQLNVDKVTSNDATDSHQIVVEQADNKSSNSTVSSGKLRADFEEINVDDIDLGAQVSPIESLGSISDGDSSFDEDCASLEHSWAECDIEQCRDAKENAEAAKTTEPLAEGKTVEQKVKPAPRLQRKRDTYVKNQAKENGAVQTALVRDIEDEDTMTVAPVKPPRSTSPKITQSTLL